jgi:large subunit ribosomal protein LP1
MMSLRHPIAMHLSLSLSILRYCTTHKSYIVSRCLQLFLHSSSFLVMVPQVALLFVASASRSAAVFCSDRHHECYRATPVVTSTTTLFLCYSPRSPHLLVFSQTHLCFCSTQADKINTVLKAAGVRVQPFLPRLFARVLTKVSLDDIILGAGAGAAAAPAAAAAAPAAGAAAAEEKPKEAAPKSESEEEDMVCGGGGS